MSSELPRVTIMTELGEIEVELNTAQAPETCANFLRYVREDYYKDSTFYRTVTMSNQPDNLVKIEVIQGGVNPARNAPEYPAKYPPVKLERTSVTGLTHRDGTISMARFEPDGATSEFFICIGDQPELDFGGKRNPDGQGFAAFGQVVSGQDVVRQIQQKPAEGQTLTPPVKVANITKQ